MPIDAPRAAPAQDAPGDDELDPELLALPDPPRAERRVTLALLALTAVVAAAMALALVRDARFAAFAPARPEELPDLRYVAVHALAEDRWVCAHGVLGAAGAIRFERPFDAGSFRLAPVAGREDLWVEVRVPPGADGGRWVPPSSFCGRVVRLEAAGLRHRGLAGAVRGATGKAVPEGAWLLVDGDDPEHSRWALALMALFVVFAAWNVAALARLVRRVR